MSRPSRFATNREAREAGWFSRRHQNLDSRNAAVAENDAIRKDDPPRPNPMKGKTGKREQERTKINLAKGLVRWNGRWMSKQERDLDIEKTNKANAKKK